MTRRCAIALILIFIALSADAADQLRGKARAIDGDTIIVRGKPVRLWGIDAPESHQICGTRPRRWTCGQAARRALMSRLKRGMVVCEPKDTDRYRRVVAVCRIKGRDLGASLVRSGFAVAYTRFSTDYISQEAEARAGKRGLWRGKFVLPWDWRWRQ